MFQVEQVESSRALVPVAACLRRMMEVDSFIDFRYVHDILKRKKFTQRETCRSDCLSL